LIGDLNFLVGETENFCLELIVGFRKLLCFLGTETIDYKKDTSYSGSFIARGGVSCRITDSLLFGAMDFACRGWRCVFWERSCVTVCDTAIVCILKSGSFEIDRWFDWLSFVRFTTLFCCLVRLVEGHSDT
jgi:hypothetical protein